ncbi:DUF4062 domain-containing protein [Synechococcus sp. PCC 7336]|uniref:DUF4062 domain-containing protein n=1 Tax=Synechococcus sp. PCC 7336 TaxID=195250 RepID=UPI00034752C3|nr:DUF4062 domain-containing protein [Synechococcus sp. PCC 7336]
MTYRAFVSSTFKDLERHREQAILALRDAGFYVDPMEHWSADAGEPKAVSQQRVVGCELCLLLVGFRRGYVPPGHHLSITQLEYYKALEEECDVLVFMLKEDAPWPEEFDDRQRDALLLEWRSHFKQEKTLAFFDENSENLKYSVAQALNRWQQNPQVKTSSSIRLKSLSTQLAALNRQLVLVVNELTVAGPLEVPKLEVRRDYLIGEIERYEEQIQDIRGGGSGRE